MRFVWSPREKARPDYGPAEKPPDYTGFACSDESLAAARHAISLADQVLAAQLRRRPPAARGL
jgi:hypothetical protein